MTYLFASSRTLLLSSIGGHLKCCGRLIYHRPKLSLSIESIAPCRHPQYFVTVQRERPEEHSSPTKSYLWDIRDFMFRPSLDNVLQDDLATILPALDCSALSIKADTIMGVADERLVFLSPDNWVCSAEINIQQEHLNPTRDSPQFTAGAVRHFFYPRRMDKPHKPDSY